MLSKAYLAADELVAVLSLVERVHVGVKGDVHHDTRESEAVKTFPCEQERQTEDRSEREFSHDVVCHHLRRSSPPRKRSLDPIPGQENLVPQVERNVVADSERQGDG